MGSGLLILQGSPKVFLGKGGGRRRRYRPVREGLRGLEDKVAVLPLHGSNPKFEDWRALLDTSGKSVLVFLVYTTGRISLKG